MQRLEKVLRQLQPQPNSNTTMAAANAIPEEIQMRFAKHHQDHVLKFLPELKDPERAQFIEQLQVSVQSMHGTVTMTVPIQHS